MKKKREFLTEVVRCKRVCKEHFTGLSGYEYVLSLKSHIFKTGLIGTSQTPAKSQVIGISGLQVVE